MAYKPIWKTESTNFAISDLSTTYQILDESGKLVYSGILHKHPNQTNTQISVSINDIAKNNLNSKIDFFTDVESAHITKMENFSQNYTLKVGNYIRKQALYNSYNYNKYIELNTNQSISENIITKIPQGAPFVGSLWFNSNFEDLVVESALNGREQHILEIDETVGGYVYFIPTIYNDLGVYNIYYGGVKILSYEIVDACSCDYVLYYVNSNGGWDTLPMYGRKTIKSDEIDSDSYKKSNYSSVLGSPQINKFFSNIKQKWQLNTGWINDEQSKKMYNLFTTHHCIMYDVTNKTFNDVIITNKSVDYKTFTNQGRKKYNYNIDVELANIVKKID
jgi:hypothetical protein